MGSFSTFSYPWSSAITGQFLENELATEISSHLSGKGPSKVFALNKLKNHTSIRKGKGRKRKSKEESVNVELDGD